MGSNFGAVAINPANLGTTSNPYTGLDTVTGKVLATSNNGTVAVFSDTLHSPNQVYVVNAASAGSLSASALNISQAVTAAFSPDGMKTLIAGDGGSSLYIYSPLQALQGPGLQGPGSNPQLTLSGPANAIAFSPNGAFAYIAESSTGTTSANLTAFNTCDNHIATDGSSPATVTLPANPLFMRVLPGLRLEGHDSSGLPIPDGVHVLVLDATGFDILTSNISPPAPGTLCPQLLTFHPAQRIELGQGLLQPVNFFTSADDTQLYVVAAGRASILVYDFGVGSVTSGIELAGNATPLSADMSVDAGTIVIAGSDGLLHAVSTGLGGSDQVQLSFPNLPNYLNPFCTFGSCTLNLMAVKP
jgi:WD40 repeat protein